jgi:hypothetical protein
MSMHTFLHWAHDTWLGEAARRLPWVFTTGLVIHFIGLSLLLGAMLVVDLRLLGFPRQMPIAAAFKFLPIALLGFVLNLLTGITFFTFDPFGYWRNPAFKIKMVLVLIAGLNALYFTIAEYREIVILPPEHRISNSIKLSAFFSLALWFSVIVFGRLIVAFQGSPDLFK